ncbi:MAG: hypothetical protein LIP12_08600 [Clostridiales bacterium]|nr:hypothetical protein [Clostridiales bacterium]
MRKYIRIILTAAVLLWIASIVVYHDALLQYISGSVSSLGALLLYVFIYGFAFYLLIRAIL